MALNIANGAKTPGASAVQWEELADTHDNWRAERANDGRYHLIAEHSGLYLHGELTFVLSGRVTNHNISPPFACSRRQLARC